MVGVNGKKFPAIREHLHRNIASVYKDMDVNFIFRKIKEYLDIYGKKYSGYDKLNLDIFVK